jgi:hypothetical protein
MAVSKVLTAFVVNQDLRIYHTHSASDYNTRLEKRTTSISKKAQNTLQKEEAVV